MKLSPEECILVGDWSLIEGRLVPDETTRRIEDLVRVQLRVLGNDASGWDTLYLDPVDGRLWELTYPQSEMEGGGPPKLACLDRKAALQKYGDAVVGNRVAEGR